MPLHFKLARSWHATVISTPALTLDTSDETKEEFFAKFSQVLSDLPEGDGVILLGYFKAFDHLTTVPGSFS